MVTLPQYIGPVEDRVQVVQSVARYYEGQLIWEQDDMHDLDPTAEASLRAAGWYPGRIIDIKRYRARWESRSIPTSESAQRFCAEFGELEILHAPRITIKNKEYSDSTKFDAAYAVDGTADRAIAEFSRIAGEELCPVGINRSHMTLFVTPSGRMLAGVDNYVFELGDHFYTALNNICSGATPQVIGEWHLGQTERRQSEEGRGAAVSDVMQPDSL